MTGFANSGWGWRCRSRSSARLSDLPLDAKELKQSKPGEYRTVANKPRRKRP
ncbi:MAG: hypothetical protein CM1200mP29_10030 [Verrucomicrobiota bacterium]|nr:MAG: hypothetical protein CM1200mP29_10030 [Verrucomicrobiota bacterium]